MKRNLVKIDESKCNGCGECVSACAEGAIAIINGKAKLVSETYCDGLGACLGHCPMDAITVEEAQAAPFDEEAVKKHLAQSQSPAARRFDTPAPHHHEHKHAHGEHGHGHGHGGGCPGMMNKTLREHSDKPCCSSQPAQSVESQLSHWPVQLKLVSPAAPYLKNADVLLVGDCVPFAMGDFHSKFLKDHVVLVGCPKLDDGQFYVEKLAQIIASNDLKTLTVVHMEVPCCFGLRRIAEMALETCGSGLEIKDVTISLKGEVLLG